MSSLWERSWGLYQLCIPSDERAHSLLASHSGVSSGLTLCLPSRRTEGVWCPGEGRPGYRAEGSCPSLQKATPPGPKLPTVRQLREPGLHGPAKQRAILRGLCGVLGGLRFPLATSHCFPYLLIKTSNSHF